MATSTSNPISGAKQEKIIYREKDIGCYVDGAIPRDLRETTDRLNKLLPETERMDLDALTKQNEEFGDDCEVWNWAIDQLTDKLQEHTDEGLTWFWEAGDLVLTTNDQLEGK